MNEEKIEDWRDLLSTVLNMILENIINNTKEKTKVRVRFVCHLCVPYLTLA